MEFMVIQDCCDFPLLKENLSEAELKYADYLCNTHETCLSNDNAEYPCGCLADDGGSGELCMAGLWLNSCIETEVFIEYIKGNPF